MIGEFESNSVLILSCLIGSRYKFRISIIQNDSNAEFKYIKYREANKESLEQSCRNKFISKDES